MFLRPYTCKHCAKTFYRWDAWKRHETRHESKGEVRKISTILTKISLRDEKIGKQRIFWLLGILIDKTSGPPSQNQYPCECFVHPLAASSTRKISYLRWMRKRICFWIQAKNPSTATHRRETVLMPVIDQSSMSLSWSIHIIEFRNVRFMLDYLYPQILRKNILSRGPLEKPRAESSKWSH